MIDDPGRIHAHKEAEIYRELFDAGYTISEIAEKTGKSPSTVGKWIYGEFNRPHKHTTTWTEDMDNTLKSMWESSASASEIGQKLGVTRNAVLGRRFRLGLGLHRESPREPKERASGGGVVMIKPVARKPPVAPPVAPALPVTEPSTDPVPFMELEECHCRAPVGKGSDGLASYCGQPRRSSWDTGKVVYTSSYCLWHHRKFHQRTA